jgi:hypothetical protein
VIGDWATLGYSTSSKQANGKRVECITGSEKGRGLIGLESSRLRKFCLDAVDSDVISEAISK